MASLLSSEPAAAEAPFDPGLTFRTPRGVLGEPGEWEPATIVFERIAGEDWRSTDITLNGRALPVRMERIDGAEKVTSSWERASSGSWLLAVRLGPVHWSRLLRVRPAKLSDSAFAAMVEDLEEGLPASIALGLNTLGAFAGLDWHPPRPVTLADEVERVRRALRGDDRRPGLIAILCDIARAPHGVLAPVRPWVPAERARRPSPVDLPAAFGKTGNLNDDGHPLKVADCRVEHCWDVYENRLLRSFRDQAEIRLRRLRRWLANAAVPQTTRDDIDALAKEFASARRVTVFLDGVGALRSAPTNLTMVLLRKPAYRAALEGYLAFRRSARVHVSHPALDAPMENVPYLYEVWGTLTLIVALLDAAAAEGLRVTSQRLHTWAEGEPVTLLPTDTPAVTLEGSDGRVVTLTPQKPFPRRSASVYRSLSFEQIPDITLEVRRHGRTALFIFDPKYKLVGDAEGRRGDGRPKKEDVDKMHAYRDAIRGPGGTRPVRFAGILYPGPDEWFGDGVAALSAIPGDDGFRVTATTLLREIISADGGRWGNVEDHYD